MDEVAALFVLQMGALFSGRRPSLKKILRHEHCEIGLITRKIAELETELQGVLGAGKPTFDVEIIQIQLDTYKSRLRQITDPVYASELETERKLQRSVRLSRDLKTRIPGWSKRLMVTLAVARVRDDTCPVASLPSDLLRLLRDMLFHKHYLRLGLRFPLKAISSAQTLWFDLPLDGKSLAYHLKVLQRVPYFDAFVRSRTLYCPTSGRWITPGDESPDVLGLTHGDILEVDATIGSLSETALELM